MRWSARRIALPALFAVALSGCLDRSDHYDDINDARANHVFEKGWLPDMLPASTYDLKVITTVEDSTGRGRFRFDSKDYRAFSSNLSPYNSVMSKDDRDNKSIEQLLAKGYEAHTYSSSRGDWVFLCNPREAICEFFVW